MRVRPQGCLVSPLVLKGCCCFRQMCLPGPSTLLHRRRRRDFGCPIPALDVNSPYMNWSRHHGGRRGYHHGNLREALIEAALRLIGEKGPGGLPLAPAARAPAAGPPPPPPPFP